MKSISVIIPCYNRGYTLARALDSVLRQTVEADEIIVVDDGSTDHSASLLRSKYPDVVYCYQSNAGVSAARNKGVSLAKGDWVAFLDSDDEWFEDKLFKQRQAWLQSSSYGLVHSDEIWIRNGVRVNKKNKYSKRGGRIFEDCLHLCAISPSSVVLNKSLLVELGGFDESLPACEDYDLWLRICSKHPVLYVDEALLNKFGGNEDQLSSLHWGLDRFRVRALNRLLNSRDADDLSDSERDLARQVLRDKCKILINGAIKRGNTEAVDYYQSLFVH